MTVITRSAMQRMLDECEAEFQRDLPEQLRRANILRRFRGVPEWTHEEAERLCRVSSLCLEALVWSYVDTDGQLCLATLP